MNKTNQIDFTAINDNSIGYQLMILMWPEVVR